MKVSRRDFLRITKDYGAKTAVFAALTGTTAGAQLRRP